MTSGFAFVSFDGPTATVERASNGPPFALDGVPQRIVVTAHARGQAARRGLSEITVLGVVCGPEQVVGVRPGREIRQSRIVDGRGTTYLVRVVVDRTDGDIQVVTVYRTSKVAKYWSMA